MSTVVVGVIVLLITSLVIRSMIRNRKSGNSKNCGGDCGHCGGCHWLFKHGKGEFYDDKRNDRASEKQQDGNADAFYFGACYDDFYFETKTWEQAEAKLTLDSTELLLSTTGFEWLK